MKGVERAVEVLNDLILINNDRTEGYEKAANNVDSEETTLKGLFYQLAEESRECHEQLAQKVRELGGEPAEEGTTSKGKIYRVWMDIKGTFSGDDALSMLEACEFGEDAAQKAYKDAVGESSDFPNDVRQMILHQKDTIGLSHNLVKNQRDLYKQAPAHK